MLAEDEAMQLGGENVHAFGLEVIFRANGDEEAQHSNTNVDMDIMD